MSTIKNIGAIFFSATLSATAIAEATTDLAASNGSTNFRSVGQALASTTEYNTPAASGFKWGKTTHVAQKADNSWAVNTKTQNTAFKWNAAPQAADTGAAQLASTTTNSYQWGTMSYADQAGFRWTNKNFAEQAGFRWTNKNFAEQAGASAGPTKTSPSRPVSAGPTKTSPSRPASAGPTRISPSRPASAGPTKTSPSRPASAGPTKTSLSRPASAGPTKTSPSRPVSAGPARASLSKPVSAGPRAPLRKPVCENKSAASTYL